MCPANGMDVNRILDIRTLLGIVSGVNAPLVDHESAGGPCRTPAAD